MQIGLIRERKTPPDVRVALTPVQCVSLMKRYPGTKVFVETSPSRCFPDEAYLAEGIPVVEHLDHCDLLLGIKEVPKEYLLEEKTYLFFSHTIKKQPHNKEMLQDIIKKRITLIDYETLRWEKGNRVLGFGRFAGIVGAYNGLLTYGKKKKIFSLKPAHACHNYAEVMQQALSIEVPPIKIVLTGAGRVANGALEFLRNLRIAEVTPEAFLTQEFYKPVFVHLNSHELYKRKDGGAWDTAHFYHHHEEYESQFFPFLSETDLLLNGIYWTQDLPRLFAKEDTRGPHFKIQVIADISCDVDGSVPITYQATRIDDPVIGWSRTLQAPCAPFQDDSIDIMAVGNLPNELPSDASEEFGETLLQSVFPEFYQSKSRMIEEATIASGGALGKHYRYLSDYII